MELEVVSYAAQGASRTAVRLTRWIGLVYIKQVGGAIWTVNNERLRMIL